MVEMEVSGMKLDILRMFWLYIRLIKKFVEEKGGFSYGNMNWDLWLKLIDWFSVRNI